MIVYRIQAGAGSAGRRPGWLARIGMSLMAMLSLVAAAFLGAFIFVVVLGVVIIAGAAMAFQVWRLKRRMEKSLKTESFTEPPPASASPPPGVIDVEFTEIRNERESPP
jgi:hypothetical protein